MEAFTQSVVLMQDVVKFFKVRKAVLQTLAQDNHEKHAGNWEGPESLNATLGMLI